MAIRRWILNKIQGLRRAPQDAAIKIESLIFHDGSEIKMERDSILVITGPNNVGKSAILRGINNKLVDGRRPGPVIKDVTVSTRGTVDDFSNAIKNAGLPGAKSNEVKIGNYDYNLEKVASDFDQKFVGSYPMQFFISRFGAEERLSLVKSTRRGDYIRSAPREPLQWLEFDEQIEKRICDICVKVFGQNLILNTLAGDEIFLNVARDIAPGIADKSAREQASWLSSLPRLEVQGDGMKSFIGTLMGVLVHPRSIMLIDEPEAFLHSPQKKAPRRNYSQ